MNLCVVGFSLVFNAYPIVCVQLFLTPLMYFNFYDRSHIAYIYVLCFISDFNFCTSYNYCQIIIIIIGFCSIKQLICILIFNCYVNIINGWNVVLCSFIIHCLTPHRLAGAPASIICKCNNSNY